MLLKEKLPESVWQQQPKLGNVKYFQFRHQVLLKLLLLSLLFCCRFRVAHNVLGLCVRAGNRSTKANIITKVQLKNYR